MHMVRLPPSDDSHFHTGYFHLEYRLGRGLLLLLLRGGPPNYPDRYLVRPVGRLYGLIESGGEDHDAAQRQAEVEGLFEGLPVEWVGMGRRWFSFPVEQTAVDETFRRVREFALRERAA